MNFLLMFVLCFAEIIPGDVSSQIQKVKLPIEVVDEIDIKITDPDIKDLQWNRWTNDNFVIVSLNDGQAKYLAENIGNIKKWIYNRWGFDDFEFLTECRLICVDSPELFEKFFNIKESQAEIQYDSEGKPKLMVVFYQLDDIPSKTIPGPLTELCLLNLDEIKHTKTPQWFQIGSQELNKSLPHIRGLFDQIDETLEKNEALYFTQGVLEINGDDYQKLSESDKQKYRISVAAFLLMLRQEFGQDRLLQFYQECADATKSPIESFNKIFKFKDIDAADQYFKRFLIKTTSGLKNGTLTDKYLQILPD